jgi:hypothetical protein
MKPIHKEARSGEGFAPNKGRQASVRCTRLEVRTFQSQALLLKES